MHFRSRRRSLARALALVSACCTVAPRSALADAPAPPSTNAFVYTAPAEKYYLRTVLEELGVLVAGSIQYANEQANSTDWDLGYDWPSFRKKLTGEAVRFDTNRFDTNMMTHPASGSAYYLAARGNRLSILESFAVAAAASTLWEYVGEFREKASINDMLVTPIAGAALGETVTQLGVFFERSRPTPVTRALALLFAPVKGVHDWIDGATPLRSREVDGAGLTREMGHRFELDAGAAITRQDRGPAWGDTRVALTTHLVNVPGYDSPGSASYFLTDGNVSTIAVEATFGAVGLADFQLGAQVAPIGWYTQSLARDEDALRGQRLFLGATAGFEYAAHLYDRVNPAELDRISGIYVGGLTMEHDAFLPPLRVRTTLDMRPSFTAVHALAIDAFLAKNPDRAKLPSVTQEQGYYFAFAATVAPAVELSVGRWGLGAQARFDAYYSISGADRFQEQIHDELALHDRRSLARAWVSFAPTDWLVARVGVERRTRDGDIDAVAASRAESSTWAQLGAVF